jgi:hypothetical protein
MTMRRGSPAAWASIVLTVIQLGGCFHLCIAFGSFTIAVAPHDPDLSDPVDLGLYAVFSGT